MLRPPTPPRAARRGYTLVELLVVIAIIGVLVGLIMAAVSKVRGKGDELKVKADLAGLDSAISQFKGKFGRIPPGSGGGPMSTFRLCSEYPAGFPAGNPANTWPEFARLKDMWPRLDPNFNGLLYLDQTVTPNVLKFVKCDASSPAAGCPASPFNAPGSPYNGLVVQQVNGPLLLDPNQCLVFFLSGGVSQDYQGFATSPAQPFTPPGAQPPSAQRLPGTPFFEYKKDRLQNPNAWLVKNASDIATLPSPPAGFSASNVFRWEGGTDTLATLAAQAVVEPWHLDPWKAPYLYMATSGVGSGGDYPFKDVPAASPTPLLVGPWGGKVSAFNNNANGPTAFRDPTAANKWLNHTTWQIVSGGPNGAQIDSTLVWGFGPGGPAVFGKSAGYTPNQQGVPAGTPLGGGDDFANFRQSVLSATD